MRKDVFDKIWDEMVRVSSLLYAEIQDDVTLDDRLKEDLYAEYCTVLEDVKRKHMGTTECIIDRHKVAATFIKALMVVKPLYVSGELRNSDLRKKWTVNETIAIHVALAIMRSFALDDTVENDGDSEDDKAFKKLYRDQLLDKGFMFPPLMNEKSSDYIECFAREIYQADKSNGLHVLSLASEMFWIESYTRQGILCEIQKQKNLG